MTKKMGFYDIELLTTSVKNLRGRKFRSFLTILGIIIGIAAIVALISLGEGLNQSVSQQFESLGTNTLIILPGGSFFESVLAELQEEDTETVSKVRGVDFAAEIYVTSQQITFEKENKTISIVGIPTEKVNKLGFIGLTEVAEGRNLSEKDSSAILLGKNFGKNILKKDIHLKQSIELEGKKLRVVGILEKATNNFGAMFNSSIVMSSDELQKITTETLTPFRIIVNVLPGEDIEEVKERIIEKLEDKHGKKDFQVIGLSQIADIATGVVGMISLVLIGIAFISLMVGGIGIMNTMLMSVMERTREIGVMKAIGATTPEIISIFVVEAGVIGLVGGLIGLLVGIGIGNIFSIAAESAGLPLQAAVTPGLIVGALAFSMAVGMIAGVYPAMRAAKIDPVEALRYE